MSEPARPGIVVIGLGVAGLSAVEGIRSVDSAVPVTVVGSEPYLAYYRPRLSHLLGSEISAEQIAVKRASWYESNQVHTILGRSVVELKIADKTLLLDDGSQISADAVVIACGSSPFVPPLPGLDRGLVFSLRSIADARAITEACRSASSACVIGAGPLGLEAAWAVSRLGVAVHLLDNGPRLLSRVLDEKGSSVLEDRVTSAGITLHLSAVSEAIASTGVRLNTGQEVPGAMVLFSTGVRANLSLAKAAGLSANRGIAVDRSMRSSVPWVYAAGDVAELEGSPGGTWGVAMAQGRVAGANAAGAAEEYKPVPPSYTLMVMGTKIFTIGEVQGGVGTTAITDDDAAGRGVYRKLVFDGDKLVGGLLMGDLAKFDKVRDGVEKRASVSLVASDPKPAFGEVLEALAR
ncbi:MAG: FAD-dependent oxidoreductase [Clostridia bacterium]|nr:FAD-dependent oxidoreductase [Clostridia bacterium]